MDNLVGRADGPMNVRLLLQPLMALALAIRSGLRDARSGRPPFLWTVLTDARRRPELLRHAWGDIGKVFIIAAVLDAIYQFGVHSGVYVLELLITATVLAVIPYCAVRGLITRAAVWMGYGANGRHC